MFKALRPHLRTQPGPAEELRRASNELCDRVDTVSNELAGAGVRLGKRWRRIEKTLTNFGEDLEAPSSRVRRAMTAFASEARLSFDRLTGRRPRNRFSLWLRRR